MGEAFAHERHSFSPRTSPEDMAARVMNLAPATDAEALRLLRSSFPDLPLSARVAALGHLARQSRSPRFR